MNTGAIVTLIVMAVVFIVVLSWCFSRIGKGGEWED